MGIIPIGMMPKLIIMIDMTRPRTSGAIASVTTLMFKEPATEPNMPTNTPKAIAMARVGDSAKPREAQRPDVATPEHHLALAADVAEASEQERTGQRTDAHRRHQVAERLRIPVEDLLVEHGREEGGREAEHHRHDAHDEQPKNDPFPAHVAKPLCHVVEHLGIGPRRGVAPIAKQRRREPPRPGTWRR